MPIKRSIPLLMVAVLAVAAPENARAATDAAQEARTLITIKPHNISSALKEIGLDAPITINRDTYHVLESGLIAIYLEGCRNSLCTSVRMQIRIRNDHANAEMVNRWNEQRIYARAYVRDAGVINMDMTYSSNAKLISMEVLRSMAQDISALITAGPQFFQANEAQPAN